MRLSCRGADDGLGAVQLLRNGRIRTTRAKAKEVEKTAAHMITLAKAADALEKPSDVNHKRVQAEAYLYDKDLVADLFQEAPARYSERPGGYTRITPTLPRRGDNAEMVYIELV